MTLKNATTKFKIRGLMSGSFNIDSVIKPGETLLATLFNFVLHETMKGMIKTSCGNSALMQKIP